MEIPMGRDFHFASECKMTLGCESEGEVTNRQNGSFCEIDLHTRASYVFKNVNKVL